MKRYQALLVFLPIVFILACAGSARATNGLFPFAFGGKSAGMGGATLASGDDALNQVINPANLPDIPRRIDFDVMWIRTNINFQNRGPNQLLNDPRLGNGSVFDPGSAGPTFYQNDKNGAVDPCCTTDNNFNIPVVGYVHPINPVMSLGVAAFGLAGGGGRIKGIDGPLYQDSKYRAMLLIAAGGPSIGIKLGDGFNVGMSVVGLGGKFSIQQPAGFDPSVYALGGSELNGGPLGFGFGNFAAFFKTVGVNEGVGYVKFKDNAGISAVGVGFRVGMTVKPAKWLRISAAFSPRRSLRFSGTAHFDFNREMENAMDFLALTPGVSGGTCSSPGEANGAPPGSGASVNICSIARGGSTTSNRISGTLDSSGSLAYNYATNPDGTVVNTPENLRKFQNALTGCRDGFQSLSSCVDASLFKLDAFALDPSKGWNVNYHTTASFVLPPQADLGIAIMPTDKLTLEADATYYWYKRSMRRFGFDLSQGDNPNINNIIGADNFTYAFNVAWKDMITYRFGAQYQLNNAWTIRGGYAYGSNPITSAGASILFPAYGFHTATVGATFRFWERYEITAALERAFQRSLSTTNSNIECFQGTVAQSDHRFGAPCAGSSSTESHDQYTGHFQLSYIF